MTSIAYGSVGPRAVLRRDETGVLASLRSTEAERAEVLERLFADASPSKKSMRAGPEYRLAMLRVLGDRAARTAVGRLKERGAR